MLRLRYSFLALQGKTNPTYASVNNGVFLCEQCAEAHKAFGSDVSCVKSITADQWDDKMLRYMRYGTSEKLKSFLDGYSLMTKPAEARYKSMAAAYYRKKVIAEENLARSDRE